VIGTGTIFRRAAQSCGRRQVSLFDRGSDAERSPAGVGGGAELVSAARPRQLVLGEARSPAGACGLV